jgi:hypothetical protein
LPILFSSGLFLPTFNFNNFKYIKIKIIVWVNTNRSSVILLNVNILMYFQKKFY